MMLKPQMNKASIEFSETQKSAWRVKCAGTITVLGRTTQNVFQNSANLLKQVNQEQSGMIRSKQGQDQNIGNPQN